MESGRSDLARAAVEVSAAAAAAAADPDLEASAGAGKGKASAGDSKGKKNSEPNSNWNWMNIIQWKEGQEKIDGLDWDDDKLEKEIDDCLRQLKDTPFVYYGDAIDDESLPFLDEQQLKMLNRRLALCRIRAYEDKYQDMDDKTLSGLFPDDDLEANEYYLDYERSFEWYFDDVYCQYGGDFQDYQRLMLRNNGEYEKWEYYRRTCSTLESDQEYVKFWETLSSTTQLIQWYTKRTTWESRIERLFYYHTLKIAAVYPHVYKTLIRSGCIEFRRILQIFFVWCKPYAAFLFTMWKLLRKKLSFEDALKRLYNDDTYSFIFAIQAEFEPNLHPLKELYKPFLDQLGEKEEEAHRLIVNYVYLLGRKPKTYYDYVKKKLGIAEKIGLIPSSSTKAPRE